MYSLMTILNQLGIDVLTGVSRYGFYVISVSIFHEQRMSRNLCGEGQAGSFQGQACAKAMESSLHRGWCVRKTTGGDKSREVC